MQFVGAFTIDALESHVNIWQIFRHDCRSLRKKEPPRGSATAAPKGADQAGKSVNAWPLDAVALVTVDQP